MPVKDQLAQKIKDIESQYSDVMDAVNLVSTIVLICVFTVAITFPLVWLYNLLGLSDSNPAVIIMVLLVIAAVGAAIVVAVFYIPKWSENYWKRWEKHTRELLRRTDLAILIMDPVRCQPIFNELDARPWLKLSGIRQPRSLDEQVEFASDYFWAVKLLLADDHRRLPTAVWWGSSTRITDDLTIWIFNGCSSWILLIMGGIFIYGLFAPLWIWWVALYIRRQAIQSTLLDYFLKNSGDPRL